jgi:hypothetical protein
MGLPLGPADDFADVFRSPNDPKLFSHIEAP